MSAKIKALHELSRLIWLELRSNQGEKDNAIEALYQEHLDRIGQEASARFDEGRARVEAALKGKAQDPPADS